MVLKAESAAGRFRPTTPKKLRGRGKVPAGSHQPGGSRRARAGFLTMRPVRPITGCSPKFSPFRGKLEE